MMQTKLITINNIDSPEALEAIAEAAALIQTGQLVAFPTETVYGLGANALDARACAGIFAAKGRPADNPLIVHIADISMMYALARPNPLALMLARCFWPGPLTLVLPKQPIVPGIVSAGLDTVAIRWPAHPLAQALIEISCRPIAAPSANISGRVSPTAAAHVYADFAGKIPLILDGGPVEIGLESTVVDVCGNTPTVLRPGKISAEEIAAAADTPAGYAGREAASRPAAPGMKYRHYAPHAELHLIDSTAQIPALREQMRQKYGPEPLIIGWEETALSLPGEARTLAIARQGDLAAYARNIFAALRRADAEHYPAVIVETVPEAGIGIAIMNRLRKAVSKN